MFQGHTNIGKYVINFLMVDFWDDDARIHGIEIKGLNRVQIFLHHKSKVFIMGGSVAFWSVLILGSSNGRILDFSNARTCRSLVCLNISPESLVRSHFSASERRWEVTQGKAWIVKRMNVRVDFRCSNVVSTGLRMLVRDYLKDGHLSLFLLNFRSINFLVISVLDKFLFQ